MAVQLLPALVQAFATMFASKAAGSVFGNEEQPEGFQGFPRRNRRRLLTLDQAMMGTGIVPRTREPLTQSNPILDAFLYGSR